MVEVFFSYAHEDEKLRDELEIHLSSLKRQGVISVWHDRRIIAGAELDGAVDERLEAADIILLLVSPYFINSDYCYEREMERALEGHREGTCRVIPVILHPCDWQGTPFGKLRATPRDGRPVSKHPNMHDAFLDISRDIRRAAEELGKGEVQPQQPSSAESSEPASSASQRSSNLRIRRTFSDHERDAFLDEAFEYVANFFENSLGELQDRNPGIDTRFRRIDGNSFSAAAYINGDKRSACKIWLGGSNAFGGDWS